MKTIFKNSYIVIILSFLHIFLSVDTVENISNPLFWLLLFFSSTIGDFWLYYYGGFLLQSIFTIIVHRLLITKISISNFVISCVVCLLFVYPFVKIRHVFEFMELQKICDNVYKKTNVSIYDIIIFMFLQSLFYIIYNQLYRYKTVTSKYSKKSNEQIKLMNKKKFK